MLNTSRPLQQMQDFLRMYSNLVERCFTACCNDFTSKALSSKEVSLPPSRCDHCCPQPALRLLFGTLPLPYLWLTLVLTNTFVRT